MRALIIRNPASRRQIDAESFDRGLAVLRSAGWDVAVNVTERAGHATELARAAADAQVDVVVAEGGDGTINEVVNGIAGTETAVAVLPGGTANVWAKEIRVSKDPVKALAIVVTGRRERMDVGLADAQGSSGRRFLLMAGVGMDAAIIPRVNPAVKRRTGALAFIIAGVTTAIRTRPWDVRMVVDGATVDTELYWMVAGNTRNYGGLVHIANAASAQDGRLDSVVMRRGGLHLAADGARLLVRKHKSSANIDYRPAREIVVETAGIPVQLDGDDFGVTPVRLTVEPLAVNVVVPADLKSPLFNGSASR